LHFPFTWEDEIETAKQGGIMTTLSQLAAPTLEDGTLLYLSPSEIEEKPGFNPRQYYDPAKLDELASSMRQDGIHQNLVVRPVPDQPGKYWIIAGHRRWRAAQKAGLSELPCLFRDVDERQALLIAAAENDKRDNIGPAEEAQQARRMLDDCDGDRDETARLLGWPRSRLDARLLLLHAAPLVLDALNRREIKVGHAELLAGLPIPTQEANLPRIIEAKMSVGDLKSKIAAISQKLSTAIFDTTDCNGCPQNSSTQQGLFSEALTEGQCTGRECWAAKTRTSLEEKRQALSETYNCVFLDIEKDATNHTFLIKSGAGGVGEAQFDQCKGCANFGVLISSAPGDVGEVTEDVCFDLACNARKVAEHTTILKAAENEKSATAKKQGNKGTSKTKSKSKKSSASATPKKVTEHVDRFLRAQAAELAATDPATIRAIALYALLKDAQKLDLIGKSSMDRADAVRVLHDLPDDRLAAIELEAVQYQLREQNTQWMNGNDNELTRTATMLLAIIDTDLTGRFVLDKAFLEAHTKLGIEALMKQATNPDGETFAKWYEADEKKTLKKLIGQKADALIESILGSGFDFSRWVPTCISERLRKVKVKRKA